MNTDNRNKLKRRIAPGIWEDEDGHIHYSIPELLDIAGLEDTPDNREEVKAMIRDMIKEQSKETTIMFRATPDDPGTKL